MRAWQGSVAGAWKLEAGFGRKRGEKGSQTEVGRSERLSRLLKRIVFRKALPSSPVALPVGRTAAEPASRLGRRATRLSQGRKDGRKALRETRDARERERGRCRTETRSGQRSFLLRPLLFFGRSLFLYFCMGGETRNRIKQASFTHSRALYKKGASRRKNAALGLFWGLSNYQGKRQKGAVLPSLFRVPPLSLPLQPEALAAELAAAAPPPLAAAEEEAAAEPPPPPPHPLL